jgi:hypothetical protein
MKFLVKASVLAAISAIVLLSSCKKENGTVVDDPTAGLTKQAEGFAVGAAARLEIYTNTKKIESGYTRFYIAVYDSVSGKRIEDAQIHLMPMMDMGTMKHSAPYENPSSAIAQKGIYPCAVAFIMSSMGGVWTVDISIHNNFNSKSGKLTIPVTVEEPAKTKIKSFTAKHDGGKYFVALIEPSTPKIGMNNLEIVVYKKASMMSFPADSSLTIAVEPEMPTMGHGSPNNVNPLHSGNGHYKGKVNFTMTGFWRLNFDFTSNGAEADLDQYIDLEF